MLQILGRVYTDCTNGEKEVDVSKNTNTNCSYHPELFHPSEEFLDNTDFDDYEAEIENEDTYKIHPLAARGLASRCNPKLEEAEDLTN
ncbi:uncharacterized protein N7469_003491 [Penicillium citrinum]|uniref:Uncharacterized protein n=1 Tax=Penicillium citrinum TaxID=5077 RepID=A0A9W9TQA3_PENCI|nr:uncharacterized protein N7469_003491 [Penicillium citrinum]KAJ5234323.1 hypothetical protein N7469_003491 [Penicillium citrinum]